MKETEIFSLTGMLCKWCFNVHIGTLTKNFEDCVASKFELAMGNLHL